jgi:hypothetical protein
MKYTTKGNWILKKLSDYLPSVKGTNKENLLIEKLLLHEAGFSLHPIYKETLDKNGRPLKQWYAGTYSNAYPKRVAAGLFASNALEDSFTGASWSLRLALKELMFTATMILFSWVK